MTVIHFIKSCELSGVTQYKKKILLACGVKKILTTIFFHARFFFKKKVPKKKDFHPRNTYLITDTTRPLSKNSSRKVSVFSHATQRTKKRYKLYVSASDSIFDTFFIFSRKKRRDFQKLRDSADFVLHSTYHAQHLKADR
jgi:hypothetical protein